MTKIEANIPETVNENNESLSIVQKSLKLVNSLKKATIKKLFYFHSLGWMGFLMKPFRALSDKKLIVHN